MDSENWIVVTDVGVALDVGVGAVVVVIGGACCDTND